MSSDSSDDDVFRRRRPAIKRSVGLNGLKRRTNLSRYGKGIELTQNKKTKGSGEVWGDSSSDDGYASGGSGSASGSGSGESGDEEFEDAENEDESKSDQEDNDKKGKSGKKKISKDAFSAQPIGGYADVVEKEKNRDQENRSNDSFYGLELSDFAADEGVNKADIELLGRIMKADLLQWVKEEGFDINDQTMKHKVRIMRDDQRSEIQRGSGPLYDKWEKAMKERDEAEEKMGKDLEDTPVDKFKKERPKSEGSQFNDDDDDKRFNRLFTDLPDDHPDRVARTEVNKEFADEHRERKEKAEQSNEEKEKLKEQSRINLKGHNLRSYELKLIHESSGMKELDLKFNNAKMMANRSLESVLEKAEKSRANWKQELKDIYQNHLHKKHSNSTKQDWKEFLAAGMRERDRNLADWYRDNQQEEFPFSDSESDTEQPATATPVKKKTKVRELIDHFTPPASRSSTQKKAKKPVDEEESKSELDESESESSDSEESEYESAVEATESTSKEVIAPEYIEALNSAKDIDDVIAASKALVKSKGYKTNNVNRIRILVALKDTINKKYQDGDQVQIFAIQAKGQIHWGKKNRFMSKADQIDKIDKSLKALRKKK